jgi:serine-type D-Ala-D-Ala carboxypeptidase (penicillin-binding protein 5/6)
MKSNLLRTCLYSTSAGILAAAFFFLYGQPCEADINARAAVVLDGQSGKILYAKNPNTKLQPASTTKLVTAMVVLDRLDPDSIVVVSKGAARIPTGKPRLRVGEKLTVRDLLSLALIRSVNSAAVALAEAVSEDEEEFSELMNEKARAIGAENTVFINASGLPGEGQHITAYDLTLIMKEALRYPVIRDIVNTRENRIYTEKGRGLAVRNTNHLLWNEDDVVGGKTGYTRSAGHCLAFAVQKGEGVMVASILGETARGNIWNDSTSLLLYAGEVQAGLREPEIYYTADADDPLNVLPRKKYKRRALSASKKTSAKQLASNKASRDRNRAEAPVKKQVKKKARTKPKENMVTNTGKKQAGPVS